MPPPTGRTLLLALSLYAGTYIQLHPCMAFAAWRLNAMQSPTVSYAPNLLQPHRWCRPPGHANA
ncbi:hypothetical protein BDR04DRAFT_1095300 [Suillus decipiens]|nr:hypothetical protein BDR04DRAFT_1095300 [Suillus decipiens]